MAVRAAESGIEQARAAKTRSRRVLEIPLSIAVTILVFGLIAAAAAYVANYDPLVQGAMSGLTPGTGRYVETYSDPETVVMLRHQEGESFFVMFTVSNDGPLPVRIEHVGEVGEGGAFFQTAAALHPGERSIGEVAIPYKEWPRLSAFTLESGEARRVAVEYRFGSCNLSRGEAGWVDSVPVRFSVLGISRNTHYQLPYILAMGPESTGTCP